MASERRLDDSIHENSLQDNTLPASMEGKKATAIHGTEVKKEQADSLGGENISVERWNNPKINIYRYFSIIYTFVVLGMNDAAYGALIP